MNYMNYVVLLLFSVNYLHGAANIKQQANSTINVFLVDPRNGQNHGSKAFAKTDSIDAINEWVKKLCKLGDVPIILEASTKEQELEATCAYRRFSNVKDVAGIPARKKTPHERHITFSFSNKERADLLAKLEAAQAATAPAAAACTTATAPSTASQNNQGGSTTRLHSFLKRKASVSNKSGNAKK